MSFITGMIISAYYILLENDILVEKLVCEQGNCHLGNVFQDLKMMHTECSVDLCNGIGSKKQDCW